MYKKVYGIVHKIYFHAPYFVFYYLKRKNINAVYEILSDKLSCDVLKAYIRFNLYGDTKRLMELARPINLMYFDNSIFSLREDEVFVDMGALNGHDSKRFAKLTNNKYGAIYMFEPDPMSFSKSKDSAETLRNALLFNEACFDQNGEISFASYQWGGSRVSSIKTDETVQVKTVRLDDKNLNPAPTFIKMDIEGSEAAALRGAEETIKTSKPKLAVCIYHKPEDIYELPKLMASLLPGAKVYIRQYKNPKSKFLGSDLIRELTPAQYAGIRYDLVCYAVSEAQ